MNQLDFEALHANVLHHIARNMRRFRLRRGLTQRVAAELSGMATRHWQKLEACDVNVGLATIIKVAVGLGLDDWTELVKEPPPKLGATPVVRTRPAILDTGRVVSLRR